MVIFALGGAAVVGITVYDNHSDWHEYSDWGEYGDAAERKRRRVEAKKKEVESAARDLFSYKKATVDPQLSDEALRQSSAMTVSDTAMDKDAKETIQKQINAETTQIVWEDQQKLKEIDLLLQRIQEIEKEESKNDF